MENNPDSIKTKKATVIAPLNHLPLLPSGPGGVRQELVVPVAVANIEKALGRANDFMEL